jgi:hypothetical protein
MAAAEQKKSYQVIKQFKGINTQANRTAIDAEEFSWLENAQPVGYGNLRITPNAKLTTDSGGNSVVQTSNIVYESVVNLSANDYLTFFLADGSATYYKISTKTKGNIAPAGTFSGTTGMNSTQWYNSSIPHPRPYKGYVYMGWQQYGFCRFCRGDCCH